LLYFESVLDKKYVLTLICNSGKKMITTLVFEINAIFGENWQKSSTYNVYNFDPGSQLHIQCHQKNIFENMILLKWIFLN
jgi:hypothetical protein